MLSRDLVPTIASSRMLREYANYQFLGARNALWLLAVVAVEKPEESGLVQDQATNGGHLRAQR